MLIRDATPGDLDAVAEIYAHYVLTTAVTFETEPHGRTWWEERLTAVRAAGRPFVVAEVDGEVAGYAYLTPWRPRPAYAQTAEDSVYVAPGRGGRGIGSGLLARVLHDGGTAGVRQVLAVISHPGSDASVRLHARHGYHEVGRLAGVGIKLGSTWDTILMQRSLDGATPASR